MTAEEITAPGTRHEGLNLTEAEKECLADLYELALAMREKHGRDGRMLTPTRDGAIMRELGERAREIARAHGVDEAPAPAEAWAFYDELR